MTPQVELRPAVPTDFLAIVALERATEHAPHWPPATYAAILSPRNNAPRRCFFVALKDGSLAGFAAGLMHPPHSAAEAGAVQFAELESVVVAASARRAGIGRVLCNAVLDWSRSLGATEVILEVRSGSAAAIALHWPRFHAGWPPSPLLPRPQGRRPGDAPPTRSAPYFSAGPRRSRARHESRNAVRHGHRQRQAAPAPISFRRASPSARRSRRQGVDRTATRLIPSSVFR